MPHLRSKLQNSSPIFSCERRSKRLKMDCSLMRSASEERVPTEERAKLSELHCLKTDDVAELISSKARLKYTGVDLDAMKAVAEAYNKRSLKEFEKALSTYEDQLREDPIVHHHISSLYDTLLEQNLCRLIEPFSQVQISHISELIGLPIENQLGEDPIVHHHISSLYDTLLEQNLCRLIEPFSQVEISHISELIGLPIDTVESKLSQMILDQKFTGTLDQRAGCLIVFDDSKADGIFTVVDSLYLRSAKIMA